MKYVKDSFVVVPNKESLRGKEPGLQAVFVWICVHANEEGLCFPSRSTLAECSGVSVRTIDKYLAQLEDVGLIAKTKRKSASKDLNLSNVYQVMITDSGANSAPRSANSAPGGSANFDTVTIPINNSIHLTKDTPASFEEFWKSYPSKVGKKKCLEIWLRSRVRFERHLPDILAFLEKAVLTDRWRKGYVKDPSTFLNQESWTDDLAAYSDARRETSGKTLIIK